MQSPTTLARRKPVCNTATLQHYLSLPRTPMQLASMSGMQASRVPSAVVHSLVREMAIRTARCYHTFHDPVIRRTLHKPHVERLRWVKTFVLREFNYCVALHHSVERLHREGRTDGAMSLSFMRDDEGSAAGPSAAALSHARLRNTDDDSFIYEPTITPTNGDAESTIEMGQSKLSSGGPSPPERAAQDGFRSSGRASSKELTREEVEALLQSCNNGAASIPLTTALKLLQPQQSLLDVMVNEVAVRSDDLNGWFSRFCRRRVAWRVLHEHLLYLALPNENQPAISHCDDIEEIIQGAGNAVVDIFSNLVENGSVRSLELDVEEDARILTRVPAGELVSSSTSPHSCPVDVRDSSVVVATPSQAIYSVEGHLLYVFREILKNACAATLRLRPDIFVGIKYAVDDAWVVVEFADYAGGIAPQHYREIWKFGWTTSEHYESHLGGFGVGLPTSKVYMDLFGGSMDIYSTRGHGTTVRVRFPKSPTEVLVPDTALPAVPPARTAAATN